MDTTRQALFDRISNLIPPRRDDDCIFIGIDGRDASGKTMFADDLAQHWRATLDREVIRISIDGFHNPKRIRYRRGRESSEAYWLDGFDYTHFHADVVTPLSPGGSRSYKRRSHDLATDITLEEEPSRTATPGSIIIVDGVFLHREELVDIWDMSVLLEVPAEMCAQRMVQRDGMELAATAKYIGGQQIYYDTCDPKAKATIIIDNQSPIHPVVVSSRHGG